MFYQHILNFILLSSIRSSIQIFPIKLRINLSQASVYHPRLTRIYLTTLHYFKKSLSYAASHHADYDVGKICRFLLGRL